MTIFDWRIFRRGVAQGEENDVWEYPGVYMSTFTTQSCSARMSLLGFARFRRMQTQGPIFPRQRGKAKLIENVEERASYERSEDLDMSRKLHEIKNNERTGIEARNRAIASLRNDTVFAHFGDG